MFDTARPYEEPRKLLHVVRGPPGNNHFEAVVVVQVDVKAGNDSIGALVLRLSQTFREIAYMVVIHKGYGGNDFLASRPLLGHEAVSNQVSQSLRAVRVTGLPDEPVETPEEVLSHRDAETRKSSHACS